MIELGNNRVEMVDVFILTLNNTVMTAMVKL